MCVPNLVYCSNDVTTLTIVKTWQSQRKLSLLRQEWTILRPYASTTPEEKNGPFRSHDAN
ncbi:hypothetical protein GGQ79_001045 [Ochrobactrum pecoris]|uniref:Uncharacterized protein n=1 Tax=Brucella pecoris TaxID=867683 RepID=A0AB34YMW5_9HYPH|nr:hypothetical protein [Brucella pecoris]